MAERRPPRPVTHAQLKARLELCREFGVTSYEETDDGGGVIRFTLGPRAVDRSAGEVLTKEEAEARRKQEFRRVATMHTRGGR